MAGWRWFNTPLQALIRELPLRALVPLALAIFALFSVLGPVNDIINGANRPLPFLIRNGLLAGVFALGYAYGSLRGPHRIFLLTGCAADCVEPADRRERAHDRGPFAGPAAAGWRLDAGVDGHQLLVLSLVPQGHRDAATCV